MTVTNGAGGRVDACFYRNLYSQRVSSELVLAELHPRAMGSAVVRSQVPCGKER